MGFLKDAQQKQLKTLFEKLDNSVKLVFFTQEIECQFCRETGQLLGEIVSLSDKITLETYNFALDKDKVERYKIDKIPAIVVEGQKDYGIRFYGIPAGYEFTSLINSIMAVSSGKSGLSKGTRSIVSQLKSPVHIQVFVTLTCPYCPKAVEMAHKLAIESDLITADMVESSEFPHLVHRYSVMAVPKVIINESIEFEGALPEKEFVENVMRGQQST